jgi:hypothetical protein
MIFTIVIALLIFWIIINNPGLIAGIISLVFMIAGGVALILFVIFAINSFDASYYSFIVGAIAVIFAITLVSKFLFGGLSQASKVISSLFRKFYDFKTIFKFFSIQLFTLGITHSQKINKIKKVNKLIKYGKEQHQLAKEIREAKEEQAEIERLDSEFQSCNNAYSQFVDLLKKDLAEYINEDYINFDIVEPTRKSIYGKVIINANDTKSIMKIGVSIEGFKVSEYFSERDNSESPHAPRYLEKNLKQAKQTSKSTQKLLLKYFKLNPEKIGL